MELSDASLLPEYSIVSIDNHTINSPPLPVAASTVHRPGSVSRKPTERRALAPVQNLPLNLQHHNQRSAVCDTKGSFLESPPCSIPNSPRDVLQKAQLSFSDRNEWDLHNAGRSIVKTRADQANTRPRVGSSGQENPSPADRSSLGILNPEMMANTSFGVGDMPSDELLRFGEESLSSLSQKSANSRNNQEANPTCQPNKSQTLRNLPSVNSTGPLSRPVSASSTDRTVRPPSASNSKDSWRGDSSSEPPLGASHGMMGTIKKRPQTASAVHAAAPLMHVLVPSGTDSLGGPGECDEDPEPSICEVQFEDAELQDLDDEFSDLEEDDWFQMVHNVGPQRAGDGREDKYSPVSIKFQDDTGYIEDEPCPSEGPLATDSDINTEDEVEAVREAMRQSLMDGREFGVGSSETSQNSSPRPCLEGRNGHFGDGAFGRSPVRQSAEGVTSDMGGGGGDGSSAHSSDEERFPIAPEPDFNIPPTQDIQTADRFRPLGDGEGEEGHPTMAVSSVGEGRLDSMYFKPQNSGSPAGRESDWPVGGGLAEQSSYHFEDLIYSQEEPFQDTNHGSENPFMGKNHSSENPFQDMNRGTENPFEDDRRRAAGGLSPQRDVGQYSAEDQFGGQFDNSLGSFGASPDRDPYNGQSHHSHGEDLEQHADSDNVFNEPSHPAPLKQYISDQSPVYLDENGCGVTDLAFQTSFATEAAKQQQAFLEVEQAGVPEDSFVAPLHPDDQFMSVGDALNMIMEDEKKFEAENVFLQEDNMDPNRTDLRDESWVMKSSMYLANSVMTTDVQRHGDAAFRISIGQFLRSRSEALGSLGGDPLIDRPNFGSEIRTPPSDRQPLSLLPALSEEALCTTGESQKPCISKETSATQHGLSPQADSGGNDRPLTMDDIGKPDDNLPPSSNPRPAASNIKPGHNPVEISPVTYSQSSPASADLSSTCGPDLPRPSDMYEVSLSDRTGALSLSAITNMMVNAPPDCKPQDFAEMIISMTKAKALQKKGSASAETEKPAAGLADSNVSDAEKLMSLSRGVSTLTVRKGSENSPGHTTRPQEKPLAQGHRSQSPCGRTPPVGSNEAFQSSRTVTVKPPAHPEDYTAQRSGDNTSSGCPSSSNVRPDGQETNFSDHVPSSISDVHLIQSPPTGSSQSLCENKITTGSFDVLQEGTKSPEWGTLRLSVGFMHGLSEQSNPPSIGQNDKQMNSNNLEAEMGESLTGSKVPTVEALSEESHLTLANEKEKTLQGICLPTNGETGSLSGEGVFKKPQNLPTKKSQSQKIRPAQNSSCLGTSVTSRTSSCKQPVPSRLASQSQRGQNKENYLNVSKPGLPDKVLETSLAGQNILSKNKPRAPSKSMNKPANTRNQAGNLSNSEKPSRNSPQNTGSGRSGERMKGLHTSSRSSPTQHSSQTSRNLSNSEKPSRNSPQSSESGRNGERIKGLQASSRSSSTQHSSPQVQPHFNDLSPKTTVIPNVKYLQKSTFLSKTQIATKSTSPSSREPTRAGQADKNMVYAAASQRHRKLSGDGEWAVDHSRLKPDQDMQPFSSLPCYSGNAHTPSSTNSLEYQANLTLDHSLPIHQSTPFYHAISPCDNSEIVPHDDTHETKTPNVAKATARVKMLEVCADLSFPDVCCVGVSTKAELRVTNVSSRWLQCVLDVQRVGVNSRQLDPQMPSPFVVNLKTIVEPHSSEVIPVIFVPKMEGLYVGQLAVCGYPVSRDQTLLSSVCQPEFVTLRASAEKPQIKVVTAAPQCLMFGEVVYGGCASLPLTLINEGQANVPLRLSIVTTSSSWHCFSFEDEVGDVSLVSGTLRPANPALRRTVTSVSLHRNSTTTVTLFCRPPLNDGSVVTWQTPPEVMGARVDVAVDTPSSQPPVRTVSLQALLGHIRLHVHKNLEPIELTSSGEMAANRFSIRNLGNLTMRLKTAPRKYEDVFTVTPGNLAIEPGQYREYTVTFTPTTSVPLLQTEISFFIEPSGPEYEATLIGRFLPKPPEVLQKPVGLLCSKNFISFGGVQVGELGSQSLALKHNSDQPVKFKVEARSNQPDVFQLRTMVGGVETLCAVREVIISPGEEFPVNLAFRPTDLAQSRGMLIIKQQRSPQKFTVELLGYGGTKDLTIEASTDHAKGGNYCRSVGPISPGMVVVEDVTVWNVGSRAAFVTVFCFLDFSFKNFGDCKLEPNKFVLNAGACQNIRLYLTPTQAQVIRCQEKSSVIGVLKFYFGDEISRILYRRQRQCRTGKSLFPVGHHLSNVNFHQEFLNENLIEKGADTLETCKYDDVMFCRGISRMVLSLVGEPASVEEKAKQLAAVDSRQSKHTRTSAYTQDAVRLLSSPAAPHPDKQRCDLDERRMAGRSPVLGRDLHPNQAPVLSPSAPLAVPSMTEPFLSIPENPSLELFPKQLIFDIRPQESYGSAVLLQNLSESTPINFVVSWPPRHLIVDKDSGRIPPRGTCSLTIQPSPQNVASDAPLPWTGWVSVGTELGRKEVAVLLRRAPDEQDAKTSEVTPAEITESKHPSPEPVSGKVLNKAGASYRLKTSARPLSGDRHKGSPEQSSPMMEAGGSSGPVRPASMPGQSSGAPKVTQTRRGGSLQSASTRPGQAKPTMTAASEKLIIPSCRANTSSESALTVSNQTRETSMWTVSPFTPAYLKVPDSDGSSRKVRRIKYDVYRFVRASGHLQAGESIQVSAAFHPQEAGCYSQCFEVRQTGDDGSHQTSYKVQLLAEALPAVSVQVARVEADSPEGMGRKTTALSNSRKERGGCVISLLTDTLEFKAWTTRQTETSKAQIKNTDSKDHRVNIVRPQAPFHVQHSSLKINGGHFVKMPVEFRPTEKGVFEGIVVFRPDVGPSLSLRLKGVAL